MRNNDDQAQLTVVINAIRNTVESILAEHPEGHRALISDPPSPWLLDGLPEPGFDVWELDGPIDDGGRRIRLLARLVTDDTLAVVYGFDSVGTCRSQVAFGGPESRADLIVSAVISEVDRGLAE